MQIKSQIRSIGIDLGKTTFHLVALGIHAVKGCAPKFSLIGYDVQAWLST